MLSVTQTLSENCCFKTAFKHEGVFAPVPENLRTIRVSKLQCKPKQISANLDRDDALVVTYVRILYSGKLRCSTQETNSNCNNYQSVTLTRLTGRRKVTQIDQGIYSERPHSGMRNLKKIAVMTVMHCGEKSVGILKRVHSQSLLKVLEFSPNTDL